MEHRLLYRIFWCFISANDYRTWRSVFKIFQNFNLSHFNTKCFKILEMSKTELSSAYKNWKLISDCKNWQGQSENCYLANFNDENIKLTPPENLHRDEHFSLYVFLSEEVYVDRPGINNLESSTVMTIHFYSSSTAHAIEDRPFSPFLNMNALLRTVHFRPFLGRQRILESSTFIILNYSCNFENRHFHPFLTTDALLRTAKFHFVHFPRPFNLFLFEPRTF